MTEAHADLLAALAGHAVDTGGVCPTLRVLAARMGVSIGSARVRYLVATEAGLVHPRQFRKHGGYRIAGPGWTMLEARHPALAAAARAILGPRASADVVRSSGDTTEGTPHADHD